MSVVTVGNLVYVKRPGVLQPARLGLGLRLVVVAESTSGHTHQPAGRLFTQAVCNLVLIAPIRRTASCTVCKLWPIIGQIFAIDRMVVHFNGLDGGDPLRISR